MKRKMLISGVLIYGLMFIAIKLIGVENREIKVLYTAALISHDYEGRKRQYIRSLNLLKQYGCDVYIVESCHQGPTFLDEYCRNVCYTKSNNYALEKGFNEGLSMSIGLKNFNFNPEDMIIKITGRYALEMDEFIQLVINNKNADVIARAWNDHDAYTALYAIRAKYFEDFLNYYLNYMGIRDYQIEHGFGDYITMMKKKGLNVILLPRVYDYLPVSFPGR